MIRRPPRSTLFPSTTLVRSAVTRELAAMPPEGAVERLERDFGLDELAARNLAQFLSDQKEQGGAVPDDRTIVVERLDRKSTRLNSSHANISYAVFCLKKKNN